MFQSNELCMGASRDVMGAVMVPIEVLTTRVDHVIGVHKFWGPGSYPEDQGMVSGMAPDFICLIMILIVKHYLSKVGKWHFIR